MNIFIVEDETPAANKLKSMLLKLYPEINIVGVCDSIESSVNFLSKQIKPDLIFMDIQLADGLSFDIFQQINLTTPVIFTTAFDQYTLKAFKVNSIDYLLKPIDENELKQAVEKYKELQGKNNSISQEHILALLQDFTKPKHRQRLMTKRGNQYIHLKTETIAYIIADAKLCFAVEMNGTKNILENNLTQLEDQLDPSRFFRTNRHLLVNIDAIKKVHTWLGSRLKLELNINTNIDTIVSRERVNEFKEWYGGE